MSAAGEVQPRERDSLETATTPVQRRADVIARSALLIGLLFSGLFAGFLLAVLVLEASMRSLPAAGYVAVRHVELAHLDDLATVLLPVALLATATLAVITVVRRAPGRWLAVTGLALLVVALIVSVLVSVPINTEQAMWSVVAPPLDWAEVRDRWQLAHLARTIAASCAFLVLAVAAVTQRNSSARR
jgi:ABC-type dipeptide/oligopeptide/nickel transport system permease component